MQSPWVVPTHRAIWARPLASTGLVLICGRRRAQDAGSAGAHAPNSLWSSFAAQALEQIILLTMGTITRLDDGHHPDVCHPDSEAERLGSGYGAVGRSRRPST